MRQNLVGLDILNNSKKYLPALVDINKWKRYKKIKEDAVIRRVFENTVFEGCLIAEVVTNKTDEWIVSIKLSEWPADEWRREF